MHAGGSLFKAPEIKRAVQTGQAQIGEVLMSLLENENPVFGADAVPFVATGFDASWKLWQAQRPVVEKILAAQGIKVLYAVAWPPQGIYTKKQLNSVADMKGLKWRAYNPATTRIAAMVGAQPLTIQAAELSQALATGVVDSFMSSGATGVDSKVWESLSHFATADAWLPKNMVIVNQKEFDKLDKATQDAVLAAAKAAEERGWKRMREYTGESLATLKANKMTVYEPNPAFKAELDKLGDTMLDRMAGQGRAGRSDDHHAVPQVDQRRPPAQAAFSLPRDRRALLPRSAVQAAGRPGRVSSSSPRWRSRSSTSPDASSAFRWPGWTPMPVTSSRRARSSRWVMRCARATTSASR